MEELIFQTSKLVIIALLQTSLAGRAFAHIVRGKNRWLPKFAHSEMALSEILTAIIFESGPMPYQ